MFELLHLGDIFFDIDNTDSTQQQAKLLHFPLIAAHHFIAFSST